MAASALPNTLRSITATKIVELKKQRQEFEDAKSEIEKSVKRQKTIYDQTSELIKGCCKLEGVYLVNHDSLEDEDLEDYTGGFPASKLRNQSRLLQQSLVDPAFPKSQVQDIQDKIIKDLQLKSTQHAHAQFFSELVTEWITADSDPQTPESDSSKFESVGRKEMHEQRKEWESIVFGRNNVDGDAIGTYLQNVFTNKKRVKQAYDVLRKATRQFSINLANEELFDTASLKTQIQGVLATDLLNEEKRTILKTFSSNKEVLKEVSDVLNMRFKSLASWNWTTENGAINVEQRRQLNGKYRVFMDEDVLDAILVHYLGIKWAVHFRKVFTKFFNSHAWSRQRNTIPVVDRERREWFLGQNHSSSTSVQQIRSRGYEADYFMTQLPDTVDSGPRNGYGESDDDATTSNQKGPLEIKHGLLHLLLTEAMLARHLRPDISHTVIRSDFKWFGPSLPHHTIFKTMEFFGVTEVWLDFFRKFLRSPLRFSQDGPNGAIQTRTTGVPMSHVLSDTMTEVVLFVMDFVVNQSTESNLYRLHDDFWFWGDLDACRDAWQQMTIFAKTMGIEFNEEKTGSVVFAPATDSSDSEDTSLDSEETRRPLSGLPAGEVRWGFLKLDPDSCRFEIDQSQVDTHIEEVKLQLDATTSIFGYIQAYNAYVARFFSNNFGKPSFSFGRDHVDAVISTLKRIHEALYPNGRVVDHLLSLAEKRFHIPASSIRDGFWFFPVANGGMELRNPTVPLANMRENYRYTPERILERAMAKDEEAYLTAEKKYTKQNVGYGLSGQYNHELKIKLNMSGDEKFMSREEFLKYREETSRDLAEAYEKLLEVPEEVAVEAHPEYDSLLTTLSHGEQKRGGITPLWSGMDAYWKWVVAVYGKEIVEKYGSLQLVQAAQVPLGVVSVMKAGKVRWQG